MQKKGFSKKINTIQPVLLPKINLAGNNYSNIQTTE